MRASHWRRRKPFQYLSRARNDNGKSESPQTAAHEVHSNQTRNEEIDITSARFCDRFVTDFRDVGSSFSSLQNVVNEKPGRSAFRSCWIITIVVSVVIGFDDDGYLSASQCLCGLIGAQNCRRYVRRTSQQVSSLSCF